MAEKNADFDSIETQKNAQFEEDFSNRNAFSTKVTELYRKQFEEILREILNIPADDNFSLISEGVKKILTHSYGENIFQNEKLNKLLEKEENKIKKEFQSCYKIISDFWNSYGKKNKSNSNVYLTNFRKHCPSTQEFALHSCSESDGKFIEVKQNNKTVYVICIECKATFSSETICCYCSHCGIEYYSSLLPPGENPNLQLATWEKYHCEQLVNQIMKCVKCNEGLYINLNTQMLICLNPKCKFIGNPLNIEWTCNLCKLGFQSNAIIYNPLEIQRVRKIIDQTLLTKHKAHPSRVPCCKLNIFFTEFYHKSECQGTLYVGEKDSNVIVVCEKCKAINYFDKFVWTCPKCGRKFKDRTALEAIRRSLLNRKVSLTVMRHHSPEIGKITKEALSPRRNRKRSVYDNFVKSKYSDKFDERQKAQSKNERRIFKDEKNNQNSNEKPPVGGGKNDKGESTPENEEKIEKKGCKEMKEKIEQEKKENKNKIIYLPYHQLHSKIDIKGNSDLSAGGKKPNTEGEEEIIVNKDNDEKEKKRILNQEIKELEKMLDDTTEKEERKSLEKEIKKIKQTLTKVLSKTKIKIFNLDDFNRKKRLGEGAYGMIFRAEHKKTKENFAVKKIIANDISEVETIQKEFEIVFSCIHPNIMKIYGICIKILDISTFSINVLMEIAESDWEKEIRKRLEGERQFYQESELKSILHQLVSALSFMQTNKISHRDIKPQNVLVFPGGIYKVADFGEAKEVKIAKQLNTLRGTELYMSPILYAGLKDDRDNVRHDAFKSDVFSLGYCFTYAADLNFEIIYKIRELTDMKKVELVLRNSFKKRYSEKFIQVMVKMLEVDEKKRFNFIELNNYINDIFP